MGNCENPKEFTKMQPKQHGQYHAPPHSIKDLSDEEIEKIKEFTKDDLQLYNYAKERFLRDVKEVEAKHKTRIMCKKAGIIKAIEKVEEEEIPKPEEEEVLPPKPKLAPVAWI